MKTSTYGFKRCLPQLRCLFPSPLEFRRDVINDFAWHLATRVLLTFVQWSTQFRKSSKWFQCVGRPWQPVAKSLYPNQGTQVLDRPPEVTLPAVGGLLISDGPSLKTSSLTLSQELSTRAWPGAENLLYLSVLRFVSWIWRWGNGPQTLCPLKFQQATVRAPYQPHGCAMAFCVIYLDIIARCSVFI